MTDKRGLHAGAMLDAALDLVILFGIEPDFDLTATGDALSKLAKKKLVVTFSHYTSAAIDDVARMQLPIGTFAETAGTYVNCEGRWQSFAGIASPVGEARPGWKVLRVIGNLLEIQDFDYLSAQDVCDEVQEQLGEVKADNAYVRGDAIARPNGEDDPGKEIDVPIYEVDAVVRRATALQMTPEAQRSRSTDS
jgi:NADH-quinone oxidoreductase subunit G